MKMELIRNLRWTTQEKSQLTSKSTHMLIGSLRVALKDFISPALFLLCLSAHILMKQSQRVSFLRKLLSWRYWTLSSNFSSALAKEILMRAYSASLSRSGMGNWYRWDRTNLSSISLHNLRVRCSAICKKFTKIDRGFISLVETSRTFSKSWACQAKIRRGQRSTWAWKHCVVNKRIVILQLHA